MCKQTLPDPQRTKILRLPETGFLQGNKYIFFFFASFALNVVSWNFPPRTLKTMKEID